ncbi:MAG TPA: hypothetical protein VMV81_06375 [Phycisphaerae bacterium]|nr:hypothetical protein [Phycisphaerae bacterium]
MSQQVFINGKAVMRVFNRSHARGLGPALTGIALFTGLLGWISGAAAQGEPTSQPGRRFTSRAVPEPADDDAPQPGLRKLTNEEIFRLRFLELRGSRTGPETRPEPITVKIDNKLVDEFLTLMEGNGDFLRLMGGSDNNRYTFEDAKADFRKLTSAQKIHVIAAERGQEFADKIHISSDPEIFVEFRKHVMPAILQGCATSGCHAVGSGDDVKFQLFKDPKKNPETTYANFIVLNDLVVDGLPVISRSNPATSLLLTYMLPAKDVKPEMRHPGKMEYKSIFQTRSASGFRRIENWIQSLKHPSDDYRIHLMPTSPRPTRPEKDAPSP